MYSIIVIIIITCMCLHSVNDLVDLSFDFSCYNVIISWDFAPEVGIEPYRPHRGQYRPPKALHLYYPK